MSFASTSTSDLCSDSLLSSSDHFSPADRPSLRRRPFGDPRLHRCRRLYSGPDLCLRRVDPFHSVSNVRDLIGRDGAPKKKSTKIVPALADDPLNMSNYGVPYSLNRRKLWELPQQASGNIADYQNLVTDHRVSMVLQKANPLRKGQLDGRTANTKYRQISNLRESAVVEMHTFDADNEIRREAKSARGANNLAQLLQKGPKEKKRRNRNGTDEIAEEERWLDLFEPRDYSIPNPTKSRKGHRTDPCPPAPVHSYFTFRVQSASRHQLNSGWQEGGRAGGQRPLTREEYREGGWWTTDDEGRPVWERPRNQRQLKLAQQNCVFPQKRRGGPCAKGQQQIAMDTEVAEYGSDVEDYRIDRDQLHWPLEWLDEEQMELLVNSNTEDSNNNNHHNMAEFIVIAPRKKHNEGKKKHCISTKRVHDASLNSQNKDVSRNLYVSKSPSFSELSAYDNDDDWDELWEFPTDEFDEMELKKLLEMGKFEEERENGLPEATTIYKCPSGIITDRQVNIPAGSKLIVRRSDNIDGPNARYVLNPPPDSPIDSANLDHHQSTMPSSSSSEHPNNGSFLLDLSTSLATKNNGNRRWFVDSVSFGSKAEADQKAVELMMLAKNGCGSSPVAVPVTASSPPPPPLFCGVCFADCSPVAGFALPGCRHGASHHFFCDRCWRRHIRQCLASSRVPITCMAINCTSLLSPNCAVLVVHQNVVRTYHQLIARKRRLCRDFVTCGICHGISLLVPAAPISSLQQKSPPITRCGNCGEFICTRCTERQHAPLNCEQRELYEQILQSNGQSLRSLMLQHAEGRVVSGVLCSNCNNLVEKDIGCDHITCPCGHQFCWRCGNKWEGHSCNNSGRIELPLFDVVFIRGPDGKRLAKSAPKFFEECADLRALRKSNGRMLYKQMRKIFPKNYREAHGWMEKFVQMSEFVELCLVKRLLDRPNSRHGQFGFDVDRLRFTFSTIPFIAGAGDERLKLVVGNPQMVEQYYGEMLGICRRIMA